MKKRRRGPTGEGKRKPGTRIIRTHPPDSKDVSQGDSRRNKEKKVWTEKGEEGGPRERGYQNTPFLN